MLEFDGSSYASIWAVLGSLRGKVSERKLRLFACACGREVWDQLGQQSRVAIEAAEGFADGRCSFEVLEAAREAASEGIRESPAAAAAWGATAGDAWEGAMQAVRSARIAVVWAEEAANVKQGHLLGHIFGSLQRRVLVAAEWITPSVLSVAGAIYDEQSFRDLPVLADALTDAGCDHDDLLQHCRGLRRCPECGGEGQRVLGGAGEPSLILGCKRCHGAGWYALETRCRRGCWALDAVLGKE